MDDLHWDLFSFSLQSASCLHSQPSSHGISYYTQFFLSFPVLFFGFIFSTALLKRVYILLFAIPFSIVGPLRLGQMDCNVDLLEQEIGFFIFCKLDEVLVYPLTALAFNMNHGQASNKMGDAFLLFQTGSNLELLDFGVSFFASPSHL